MNKGDVALLGQLLVSMKEAVEKLEESYEKKSMVRLSRAKKEISIFQRKIKEIL